MLVPQFCLTLCDPLDCSPPDSFIHGILQGRMLVCVAISFSRGPFWPMDQTQASWIGRQILYCLSSQGSPSWNLEDTNCKYLSLRTIFLKNQYGGNWLLLICRNMNYLPKSVSGNYLFLITLFHFCLNNLIYVFHSLSSWFSTQFMIGILKMGLRK